MKAPGVQAGKCLVVIPNYLEILPSSGFGGLGFTWGRATPAVKPIDCSHRLIERESVCVSS